MIYVNKIENRTTFRIKTGYYLEILTTETMKLLGSTKSKITKDRNVENVPYLEVAEVVLIHCDIVNNNYQRDYIEACFTDQSSKLQEIEDKLNITSVIKV